MVKQSHRALAMFLLFCFLPSLFPVNMVFASNNGPNAPEAASFEPVDATDMVNLVTGDMSYVLPLLNVPSPEGGYPISLSYHAGIAMEQEASWVGLGWSLNPGAINRGVNGYPDDWGKTNFSEFFADEGYEEDFYDFSAGVTLNGSVSVGIGASWGSNQSLGGYVSAGFGIGQASIGGSIGTNGASINGGIGGFNASIGTNGIGLGYGQATSKGSNTTIGASLNYNYSSGLSGGISASSSSGKFKGTEILKRSGLGINFGSSGISASAKINGYGVGTTTTTVSPSNGDWDVNVSSFNFFLPVYIFYVGYNHTNVKYSLFKQDNLSTSGMLYPVAANALKPEPNSTVLSRSMKERNFMDVNIVQKYNDINDVSILVEEDYKINKNNLVLPSYDNYSVTGQGISGIIKPYFHSELNLSGRGRSIENGDNQYMQYLNHDFTEYVAANSNNSSINKDAVNKVNFTFESAYNSFLRTETSLISNPNLTDSNINGSSVLDNFVTQPINYLTNSIALNSEGIKRESNYIRTYTNQEIREGMYSNYIEASNINRQDLDTFVDEGIGAYSITTPDGKTYHYSLPVYNYESIYKNFKDPVFENVNFFEIKKTKPYATHWLLTGVTGPDYIDKNTNGKLDEGDYGYWVEFDYGKWSDGYIWQGPNGRYSENKDDEGNVTYSYVWGRKQLYYLDAIKTRTHTALFVKDIKNDGKSEKKEIFKNLTNAGSFSHEDYKKIISEGYKNHFIEEGQVYSGDGTVVPLNNSTFKIAAYKFLASYANFQPSSTLALKKIILLKNEQSIFDKTTGNITNQIESHLGFNIGYRTTTQTGNLIDLYKKPPNIRTVYSNQHQNVLDVKDIEGLNLESKAQQVIDFDFDYSLAQGSPNSDAPSKGRLSLNRVNFKGKGGVQLIPPYKFNYHPGTSMYNHENIDDWGYYKFNPKAWSLNEITTPTGAKIEIDYEEDSYYAEAATYENLLLDGLSYTTDDANDIVNVTYSNNISVSDYFDIGRQVVIHFKRDCDGERPWITAKATGTITGISGNTVSVKAVPGTTFRRCADSNFTTYIPTNLDISIKANTLPDDHYTMNDDNGKRGGGIRVKSLQVIGDNNTITTEYIYTDPSTNTISGITSYVPSKEDSKGIPYVSELPSPYVMYGHVKMVNKDNNNKILGSTAYEFETLKPAQSNNSTLFKLGEAFEIKEHPQRQYNGGKVVANKYTIYNKLGNIGRILSVSSYNSKGHKLYETVNKYKSNLDSDGEIGVTQESHKSLKRVFSTSQENFLISSTSKVSYPSILESTTTHQGNFTKITNFNKYDFLTGQVLETTTEDSQGNSYKSISIPAYTIAEYAAMGSKIENAANKNMLVQEAMNKTQIKVANDWKNIGVGITTWQPQTYQTSTLVDPPPNQVTLYNNHDVWRKHKSFVWNGITNDEGLYTDFYGEDGNFNWALEQNNQDVSQSNSWKQISEVSKYDIYSMPLEVIDVNGNKAATKMGDRDSKIIAVGNAGYNEIIYSGAEYRTSNKFDGGNINFLGQSEDRAHTGKYSIKINSEQGFNTYLSGHKAGTYKISVWASKDNYSNARINDGSGVKEFNGEKVIAGDWVMLNHYVDLTSGAKIIYVTSSSGTTYFDDFRIHPVASSMTSYVYNEWDELSHILGANNLATAYTYDAMGHLIKTESEVESIANQNINNQVGGFEKAAEYKYNYKLATAIDLNGNGVIDPHEGLEPLRIRLDPENYDYSSAGTLRVVPTGGSGNYGYSYAMGLITNADEANNLVYGTESNNFTKYISNFNIPCTGDQYGYKAYLVKIRVRDLQTNKTVTSLAYYAKNCDDNTDNQEQ